ncbi:MAG: tetratricopeptide repeat protein, partial [Sphingobacteriales bacterium]
MRTAVSFAAVILNLPQYNLKYIMKKQLVTFLCALCFSSGIIAQPTHAINDSELQYKEAKELISKEQYALAYPLVKELLAKYPENKLSDYTYLREDILYFDILCRLRFMHDVAAEDAVTYINGTNNEPRRQMLAFHLAHYYFLKEDYEKAIEHFTTAGYDNISNDQAADAKFELAYSYFNLKQFGNAKPLFAEIIQIPGSKYFIPAQYYYGFISYNEGNYDEALKAFKFVETVDPYQGIVPYYISEIYYFQGKKEESLRYGQSVLDKGGDIYYKGRLNLLIGQLHYEKQDYAKALPLLDEYVNNSEKVSKEVMYEWSYANYKQGNVAKAIDGFRQLSSEKDSMGQNSMYLLGDLYLKTGDKANARNAFQFSAYNSSNPTQQKVSRFNYGKLSYELGYQDIALTELRKYIQDYPGSEYDEEAKEILLNLLSRTNNFREAMSIYQGFQNPTVAMQRVYP